MINPSMEELSALSYRELQQRAKALSIAANLKKDKLVSMIYEHHTAAAAAATAAATTTETETATATATATETATETATATAAEEQPELALDSSIDILLTENDVRSDVRSNYEPEPEPVPVEQAIEEIRSSSSSPIVQTMNHSLTEGEDECASWMSGEEVGEEDILVNYLKKEEETFVQDYTSIKLNGLPTPNGRKTVFTTSPIQDQDTEFKIDWGIDWGCQVQSPLKLGTKVDVDEEEKEALSPSSSSSFENTDDDKENVVNLQQTVVETKETKKNTMSAIGKVKGFPNTQTKSGAYIAFEDTTEIDHQNKASTQSVTLSSATATVSTKKGVRTSKSLDKSTTPSVQLLAKFLTGPSTSTSTSTSTPSTSTSFTKSNPAVVSTSPYRQRNKVLHNGRAIDKTATRPAWGSRLAGTVRSSTGGTHKGVKSTPTPTTSTGAEAKECNEAKMNYWLSKSARTSFTSKDSGSNSGFVAMQPEQEQNTINSWSNPLI